TLDVKEPTLKEPGVYVRSTVPDHELDVLWDRGRKRHEEHSRWHVGTFVAGAVVGSLVTLAVSFFFVSTPGILDQGKPAILEEDTLTTKDLPAPPKVVVPAEETEKPGLSIPFMKGKPQDAVKP